MSTPIWANAGERVTSVPWSSGEQERPWCITPSRLHLFGIPLDRLLLSQAIDRLESWIQARSDTRLVLTPDTTALMRSRWDSVLKEAYRTADLVTADGTGLVWASWILGAPLPERVSGIDLLEALWNRAAAKGYRLFFLGAKPGVADAAAQQLKTRFPLLNIVGVHHGYFDRSHEEAIVNAICDAAPDLLLVGMGVPRQESWILRMKDQLNVPVIIGVGGSFDVLSGQLRRAPRTWQTLGIEWLWRAIQEPQRFWRVRVIPLFVMKILCYRLWQFFA